MDRFDDTALADKAQSLWSELKGELSSIEGSLSAAISTSSVSAFNSAAAGATVEIDANCYEVLNKAIAVYNLTDGYYNPAVYYNVDLYGFAARSDKTKQPYDRDNPYTELPAEKYIEAFRTLSQGFKNITLSQEGGKYYVTKPEDTVEVDGVTYSLKIDLGGIGKGYATDMAATLIKDYGFDYGVFSFGSSSIWAGKSYGSDSEVWQLGFTDPRQPFSTYLSSKIKDVCLSSSGDYEQYYLIGGKRYCHIINPKTGRPIDGGIIAATVIGATAIEGDALTTALCAMDLNTAVNFINTNLSGYRVALAYEDGGKLYAVTNAPDEITVTNTAYTLLNSVADGKIVLNNVA